MAFKQDTDFLRFITMGAAGSSAVAHALSRDHGHRMVELERYAMANKIWTTKLKRLRVPDLMCLDCGLRVEARAKSNLEIKVSDSETPGREWDAGLRDDDLIAFVRWDAFTERPSDIVECFTVADMRGTLEASKLGPRKSASEGAERDRSWPARVPKHGGQVTEVDEDAQRVRTLLTTGRRQSYSIPLAIPAFVYVEEGEFFDALDQFLIGAVPAPETLDCPGGWDPAADLDVADPIARYIAVKASGARVERQKATRLERIANEEEDPRIALEALASLARIDPERYTEVVAETVIEQDTADRESVAMAMEALFVLSELGTDAAARKLHELAADGDLTSEQRCAAVWGLGVAGVKRNDLVLDFIADPDDDVALHALAGVESLDDDLLVSARDLLERSTSDREAASASSLLASQGGRGADVLLDVAAGGGRPATWAIVALGDMSEAVVRRAAAGRLTDHVESHLQPMWARASSWLLQEAADTPLDFLRRQTIRHPA